MKVRRGGPSLARHLAQLLALLACLSLMATPVSAQSILRDAETEALLADISKPLITAAGLSPANVQIILIDDPSINAFVVAGQNVYIHSGLITAADDVNEVQGVIAHELGHIAGGHAIRFNEGYSQATKISLLSLLAGVALAAAGAGEAAAGVMAMGQQAALGNLLAYSRVQESSADQAGSSYLRNAGISGKGMIDFFKTLQSQEFRTGVDRTIDYAYTHPLSGDRISRLETAIKADPAYDTPIDSALEQRFERVKAKLAGYVEDPTRTLKKYPESDTSVPARYARAFAWHKSSYPEKALAETKALIAAQPDNPYFLELEGQVLLESGRPVEAIAPLRKATALSGSQPLIASMFGHALIETEDPQYYDEAEHVLRAAVSRDRENPFAWYQLGTVYAREGDDSRAALASAERFDLTQQWPLALRYAEVAMAGIDPNAPDWLRAQDIAYVARAAIEKTGKKRR
ncbi:M48 family metalloprotease [Sphingorhabdus soli]|uniref:M48 family metalloprotease n=2 Tax=Flavisphingopyxis soli TaxID=2601267 RepID=A0A5C6UTX8_9SPHN|nr:M48 family metalloprotease [Sphingorhabdus soli]